MRALLEQIVELRGAPLLILIPQTREENEYLANGSYLKPLASTSAPEGVSYVFRDPPTRNGFLEIIDEVMANNSGSCLDNPTEVRKITEDLLDALTKYILE